MVRDRREVWCVTVTRGTLCDVHGGGVVYHPEFFVLYCSRLVMRMQEMMTKKGRKELICKQFKWVRDVRAAKFIVAKVMFTVLHWLYRSVPVEGYSARAVRSFVDAAQL